MGGLLLASARRDRKEGTGLLPPLPPPSCSHPFRTTSPTILLHPLHTQHLHPASCSGAKSRQVTWDKAPSYPGCSPTGLFLELTQGVGAGPPVPSLPDKRHTLLQNTKAVLPPGAQSKLPPPPTPMIKVIFSIDTLEIFKGIKSNNLLLPIIR